MMNKLNVASTTTFSHHRDGWSAAVEQLIRLHRPDGPILYDWLDRTFRDGSVIRGRWCGFLHNAVTQPEEYRGKIHPLSQLVRQDFFCDSLAGCLGLFTLSRHTAGFLRRHVDVPVCQLIHPARTCTATWSADLWRHSDRRLVSVGQWLRRRSIQSVPSGSYRKVVLMVRGFENGHEEMARDYGPSVEISPYLNNYDYDKMLQKSVVFLDLYDVAACNVVLECIMRNTPALVRLLPGAVEYLGPSYPLYFESVEEAGAKLDDDDLIVSAHEYLSRMDKTRFSPDWFYRSLVNSELYAKIPCVKI